MLRAGGARGEVETQERPVANGSAQSVNASQRASSPAATHPDAGVRSVAVMPRVVTCRSTDAWRGEGTLRPRRLPTRGRPQAAAVGHRTMICPAARDIHRRPIPGKTLGRRRGVRRSVRKRVLIVDDHEPFRAVARELLEGAGYVVAGEAGGRGRGSRGRRGRRSRRRAARRAAPRRDGFAVAAALAAADGPAVVLISSRDADDYGRRVAACGARGFIPKSKLSAAAFAALLE